MEKQKNKKEEEEKYLNEFLNSSVGKSWSEKNQINHSMPIKNEAPDFLFRADNDKTISIEITKLIVKNENTEATQQLITIGNRVRTYIKKEYNLDVSLIIDKYDKRKFSCKWSDHLDSVYHPGFSVVPYRQLKSKIIEGIDNNIEEIEKNIFKFGKFWVDVDGEFFQITVKIGANYFEGNYCVYVNNCHRYIENPIEDLKKEIEKKNKKCSKYKTNCDKCFLLIVIPGTREGCFCGFKSLNRVRFANNFDGIFLYSCNDNNITVLKTSYARISIFNLILKLIVLYLSCYFCNYIINFEPFL